MLKLRLSAFVFLSQVRKDVKPSQTDCCSFIEHIMVNFSHLLQSQLTTQSSSFTTNTTSSKLKNVQHLLLNCCCQQQGNISYLSFTRKRGYDTSETPRCAAAARFIFQVSVNAQVLYKRCKMRRRVVRQVQNTDYLALSYSTSSNSLDSYYFSLRYEHTLALYLFWDALCDLA